MNKRNLPIYKITIDNEYSENDEDLGIDMIAFTSTPAIKVKGLAFNSDIKKVSFKDDLKYRIAAPIMIPGDIYRCDEDNTEYFVQFSAEEIEKIFAKFMSSHSKRNVFNLEHDSNTSVPAYILESFLVDSENKIKLIKDEYNIDVPLGTAFVVSQITDKEYYNYLVDNDQVGYSIEGFLALKLSEIKEQINKQTKMEKEKEVKLAVQLPEGEFQIGDKTYVVDAEGNISEKVEEAQMAEEVAKEEKPLEEKLADAVAPIEEEKLAEEPVAPEAPVEADGTSYSKEEVDAKFDELYQMIADLKAEEVDEEEMAPMAPTQLSAHSKFAEVIKFANSKIEL
jgi:hypothetical protein